MDWVFILCISPIILMIVLALFNLVWNDFLNPYLANYSRFNGRNDELGSEACVKLTYKQWCDFAAIKPEAFCIKGGCLYEVNKSSGCWGQYTKIHFNLLDYLRFVVAYNRMKRDEEKAAVNQKETDDMSAFLHRMQDNIKEYRSKIDAECSEAKKQLSEVAENMLKKDETSVKRTSKQLRYKGTYPPDDNVNRSVGDLYMSKDGKQMYVFDTRLNFQKWDANTLLTYISKHGLDVSGAFDFFTSSASEFDNKEDIKYNYLGNGLTKMVPQMKKGDIYYNPILKLYMVMEASGEMSYLDTDDFVDRFGGISSCQNV